MSYARGLSSLCVSRSRIHFLVLPLTIPQVRA